ncbi:MAG: acetyl-coenzyme A synthetase N-terminal domain-containing protein, partial [Bacteroidota bacterium]
MAHLVDSPESYRKAYKASIANPEQFWSEVADTFVWRKKWDQVLDWDFRKPDVKWFIGGKLNITENCIDRHLDQRGNQTAILWEPNDPKDEPRKISYRELHDEVSRVGNMLRTHGVGKGDRVCI